MKNFQIIPKILQRIKDPADQLSYTETFSPFGNYVEPLMSTENVIDISIVQIKFVLRIIQYRTKDFQISISTIAVFIDCIQNIIGK